MSAVDPELTAEQAYVDRAYEDLEEMRRAAVRGVHSDVGVNARAQEAIHQMFLSRLADLSEETALCFGRIDRSEGDLFYVGRRHVHDANLGPVVVAVLIDEAQALINGVSRPRANLTARSGRS